MGGDVKLSDKVPRTPAQLKHLLGRLDDYMKKKGMRSTTQRRLIAETFLSASDHVTIEELLQQVRSRDPKVGYATVYRTLKLFTECGIATERNFRDGPSRYELSDESTADHHDHLICQDCGDIVEFHDERIEAIQDDVAKRLGFLIKSHRHEVYAACQRKDCLEQGKRKISPA